MIWMAKSVGALVKNRISSLVHSTHSGTGTTTNLRSIAIPPIRDSGNCTWRTQTSLGNYETPVRVYSYAGKVTLKLSNNHQVEGSIFGDPTYGDFSANGNLGPQTAS